MHQEAELSWLSLFICFKIPEILHLLSDQTWSPSYINHVMIFFVHLSFKHVLEREENK